MIFILIWNYLNCIIVCNKKNIKMTLCNRNKYNRGEKTKTMNTNYKEKVRKYFPLGLYLPTGLIFSESKQKHLFSFRPCLSHS